ncbi:MAG TPA: alpha-hydroxy acid oxidase [Candidatus Udaeobacter sp.]|nr:alpha-hydroxy acid oxidase [Candidatus Udaeobacter sp.]
MFRFAQHDRSVQSPRVLNIEDLRHRAKRRLPRVVFDYIDGGAENESTLRANYRAFHSVALRPRCAVATPACDLRTTVLGTSVSMPLILAPVGSCRLMFPRGEEAAARAAGEAGILCTLSTLSGCRMEDVAAAGAPVWYQLYLVGGRECALGGIQRAQKAGFSALVVTIDTPVAGLRERDLRNGAKELLSGNIRAMLPFVSQLIVRPQWLAAFLADGGLMKFENVVIPGSGPMLYADVTAALEQSVVTWDDLRWIREAWRGPIVIKGVHTAEDARRAVELGANAVVVSNHGGRQLDGVAPTLSVLPEVLAAVGNRIEVLLDGGIRRGSDIVKALCLGARAVMAGRAYAYGLGAAGPAGVARAIEILRSDLLRTLKLLGCASVTELDQSYVNIPREWIAGRRMDSPY